MALGEKNGNGDAGLCPRKKKYKLTGSNQAGINRIYWDLRYEPSEEVRLRTSPLYAPWLQVGPNGWRPAPGARSFSILAPPGSYTVKITAGEHELTQPLIVLKDPNSGGSEADIQEQMVMLFELTKDLNDAAAMMNRVELVRSQLDGLCKIIDDLEIRKSGEGLSRKLMELEMNLVDLRLTDRGQDGIRFGAKLISKINYLGNGLASGDFKPTDQQLEVQRVLEERLHSTLDLLGGVLSKELGAFNEMLRNKNVPNIISK